MTIVLSVLGYRALDGAEERCAAMRHALAKQDYAETLRNGTVNLKCVQFYDGMPPVDVAICFAGLVSWIALLRSGAMDWSAWKLRLAEKRRLYAMPPADPEG